MKSLLEIIEPKEPFTVGAEFRYAFHSPGYSFTLTKVNKTNEITFYDLVGSGELNKGRHYYNETLRSSAIIWL